jgi:steroid delta-isomerase-like uncharacterized protein
MRGIRRFSFLITVIVSVLFASMLGCGQNTAKLEENKAIHQRAIEEIWNQGKLDVADELLTANFVFHEPSGDINGPEGYKQFVTMYLTGFPDLKFTIEEHIAEGDKVVGRWTCRSTHTGEFMGIAPTGKKLEITGISMVRIADGKIAEEWVSWDGLGLLQQLGVIPPMGQGTE